MRKFIEKHFGIVLSSLDSKIWIIAIAIFLSSRLFNLTILPIFTDEAIYIRWAEISWHANFNNIYADPSNPPEGKITQVPFTNIYLDNVKFNNARNDLFVPLSDGKQPLFIWSSILPMLFTTDHLWAGRFPSVLSGLGSFIGIWLLTHQLFKNKKIAYIASFTYFVLPFTFLYDRMMLADSMLTMWGIWSLYLALRLLEKPSLKLSIILGIVYGLGLLTKSPSLFYWALAPVVLLLLKNTKANNSFDFNDIFVWKWSKEDQSRLLKWIGYWGLSVVIGQMVLGVLRLSNMYHMIGRKNLEFVVTSQEFLERPFSMLYGNMIGTSTWFFRYFGIALVLCAAIAVIRGVKSLDKKILILILLAIIPWISSASFAKVLYPRYLLFYTPPLIILVSYGVYTLNQYLLRLIQQKSNSLKLFLVILLNVSIYSFSAYFTSLLIFDPTKAPMPIQDKAQYVEDWPSGYGVEEVYQYLKKELETNGKLAVGTEGTFGLMPYALQIKFFDQIYNNKNPEIELFVDGYWPFINVPQKLVEYAVDRPTYFVVYQTEKEPPKEYPLKLVLKIQKPGAKTSMRLYKVEPVARYLPNGEVAK